MKIVNRGSIAKKQPENQQNWLVVRIYWILNGEKKASCEWQLKRRVGETAIWSETQQQYSWGVAQILRINKDKEKVGERKSNLLADTVKINIVRNFGGLQEDSCRVELGGNKRLEEIAEKKQMETISWILRKKQVGAW